MKSINKYLVNRHITKADTAEHLPKICTLKDVVETYGDCCVLLAYGAAEAFTIHTKEMAEKEKLTHIIDISTDIDDFKKAFPYIETNTTDKEDMKLLYDKIWEYIPQMSLAKFRDTFTFHGVYLKSAEKNKYSMYDVYYTNLSGK